MKRIIILAGLVVAAGLGTAQAQNDFIYAEETGRVLTWPIFGPGQMMLFSQQDNVYGTARTAAMGGAFTSLGADLSSMSINPAGLGMYQSSDWGFTTALSIDGMKTTSRGMPSGTLASGGSRLSLGLNNLGAAYNVYSGSGTLTSLTLGIAYNRAANFNSRTKVETFGEESSIADVFARQLNYYEIPSHDLNPSADPFSNLDIDLEWWGATLGWQTGMVGLDGDGYGSTPLDTYFDTETRGGIYEYDFSLGANIRNILYLGATLGITDINYSEDMTYEENFYAAGSMWYHQRTNIAGSGLTAKLGLVVRPVEALRIGVAFHLPTYYTLEKKYSGTMEAARRANTGTFLDTKHFKTAPRILAGISGVIARRAIVAVDWEVALYDQIGLRKLSPSRMADSKAESEELYKPAHTFRAGLEYRVTDGVALRAGGAYMADFMRRSDIVATQIPTVKSGYSITAGVGFDLGGSSYLDVAYVYNRANYIDYDYYYFDDGDTWTGQFDMVNGSETARTYSPLRNRHVISLTLGTRF